MRGTILFICLVFSAQALCQNKITGIVTNLQQEALPFVNILINGNNREGVSTDLEGRFEINEITRIDSLVFSYVGYEIRVWKGPFSSPLHIQLRSTSYEIATIEIIAGENPAHRIIRKVVANRGINDHDKMPAYECITYNKMNMGFIPKTAELDSAYAQQDTTKERIQKAYTELKKIHRTFEQQDMMLIESVSKRKFKYPKDVQEEILHNRVSGFQELPLATLATDAQPFSFYEEQMFILDKTYLNPISKGSTKKYFFQIQDTLYQNQDSIFIISFQPKKGKNFDGLKGVLYLHTNQYAIRNVIAEPYDKGLINFKIEQQYQWIEDEHWFPEQLNFEVHWEQMAQNHMAFVGTGKTYVSDINLQPNFSKKTFRKAEGIVFDQAAFSTVDSTWTYYRVDSLTAKEKRTYEMLDSIGTSLKLDKRVRQLAALTEGRLPLGVVDWVWRNSIGFNRYEKVRLGIGLSTNETLSDHFELGGYYAYGFGDKAWKYGLQASIFFDEYEHHSLEFQYRKDIAVPALLDYQLSNNILTAQLFSEFIDTWEYKGAIFHSRPIKYLSTSLSFGQHQVNPTYDYTFGAGETIGNSTQIYTEVGLNLRYAFNEKFSRFLGYNIFEQTRFPIIELNFTKGFDNFWEGQYAYSKMLFSLEHSFPSRLFGETHYRIEVGKINQPVPLSRLFAAPAFGNNLSVQLLSNSFRTMDAYEFISDQFIHFFFRQDFGSLLLKTKRFQPKVALEHNIAFGNLRQPELHQGIEFNTLEKGFFEAGIVINDLIRYKYLDVCYLGLGVSGFYRYGPYAFDRFQENTRVQATFTASF